MSSPEYEPPEELIKKIESLAVDIQNEITFAHDEKIFSFYTNTKDVEVKVNGEKSHMSLQRFGEKYKAPGLTDLLRAMSLHYSIIQSI